MKKCLLMGILAVLTLGVVACANEDETTEEKMMNSLSVFEDGSIENVIVEDFSENYYNVDDLTKMIQDTISLYKKEDPDSTIVLETCELLENQVKVVMKYNSSEAYSGYNGEDLFVGTIQEAYDEGYDLNIALTGTDKEALKIGRQELLGMGENHIVILENTIKEGSLRVNCYDTILYTGDGVSCIEKKKADVTSAQDFSVIVFK
ncbi:MAG: hypothetical protein II273_07260 [Lachnospiraceae bacterium]|nr:hypothetical protein [Lachnospiraceae bacterium]MEE1256995.1 hypothetical protein [Lachnospiraceae bacterium]